MRLSFPCLCLVTDRRQCGGRPIESVVADAVEGGVGIVQLREKDLPSSQLYALALRLKDAIAGRALLFVNDRVDVALACGADGVQLGEDALPLNAAKAAARGGNLILSRSVHSIDGAIAAQAQGADLLTLGTIFPTGSHPGVQTGGLELVKEVVAAVSMPFLAIGGVKPDNTAALIAAGASGAAVISAIAASPDPRAAASELMRNMKAGWAARPQPELARQP